MKQTFCIRRFEPSDVDVVCDLIHHTIDVSYTPVYSPRAILFFKDYHSRAALFERNDKGSVLVLEKQGHIIGTGSLLEAEILGVFVHPEYQHQGLGKSIMHALENKAIANDIAEVTLSVSLPSRRFYESLGYHIIEKRTIDVGEGQCLNYWQAKKTLKTGH